MLRELGSRSQHSFAAIREPNELVLVQRFVRTAPAGSGGRNEDLDGAIPIDAEAMALMLRDARCLAKNWHPNVARVRHVELTSKPQSVLTVASDFIDGATLQDLVAARATAGELPLALPILARVLLDVLAGLHALHGLRDGINAPLGAIHGELCPANVVVGKDGVARIVNVLRKRPFRVRYGSEAVGYAAPEALDATGTADLRSDVYAVGVMLWEGLAGRKLTNEPAPGRILTRQREGELTAPPVATGSPFARLADVAMRALSFDPALRYRGAAEMAADIRKIVDARLASGASVATCVTELAGDRIRSRRAALEPAMSGTRKRASEHSIAAAEKTVRRRAMTDEQIAEAMGIDPGAVVAVPSLPPLPPPLLTSKAGIESAEHLIVAALSGATEQMRAVAIERAGEGTPALPLAPPATPAMPLSSPAPEPPASDELVIPIEVTATWHESAPRTRRRLLVVAVLAAAAVFAMALLFALRTRATSRRASSPESTTTVVAPTSLAAAGGRPAPTNGDPRAATSDAANGADPTASAPSPTSAGRPAARPTAPTAPPAPAKPKKSIYEPDGL
jgi:serine/threonine-protein kinase